MTALVKKEVFNNRLTFGINSNTFIPGNINGIIPQRSSKVIFRSAKTKLFTEMILSLFGDNLFPFRVFEHLIRATTIRILEATFYDFKVYSGKNEF